MIDWPGLLGLLGPVAITVALITVAQLSKRIGSVTRTPHYYLGLYMAAALMGISTGARMLNIGRGPAAAASLGSDPTWVLLYVGLPTLALTIAVIVAWRYWSWLLAERS
jgi:hypothetical protein